jgi:7,8-dihydroneopterin aldolase/epimerase/oxygenase
LVRPLFHWERCRMNRDRIILDGMVFYGYHGVNQAERELGQRFVVDVELALDLSQAGLSDDLALTVNYATVFKAAREVVEGEAADLIETVAERLAGALLGRFPVEAVRIRVKKPWAPIKGSDVNWVAVEITRQRGSVA